MAALAGLIQLGMKLNAVVEAVAPAPEASIPKKRVPKLAPPTTEPPPAPPKPTKFANRSGSWMKRRR